MRLSDIRPFVRQAIVSKMVAGSYIFHKLKTRDHRLFYILGGGGSIVIEGVGYRIEPGMLVLFRSGTEYIWQVEDMRYIAINFDYTREHTHLRRSFHVERSESVDSVLEPDVVIEDAPLLSSPLVAYGMGRLEDMLMNIVSEFALKTPYLDEYVSAALTHLITSAIRTISTAADRSAVSNVRDIITYIQENYASPIKNTDIAAAMHFNPSYMNRLFKSYTGISLRAFLIDYRINAAAELLLSGELAVADVAAAVGFSDVPHFTKTFKAHTGRTPTEYRANGTREEG